VPPSHECNWQDREAHWHFKFPQDDCEHIDCHESVALQPMKILKKSVDVICHDL
jgi:hypothetical protein